MNTGSACMVCLFVKHHDFSKAFIGVLFWFHHLFNFCYNIKLYTIDLHALNFAIFESSSSASTKLSTLTTNSMGNEVKVISDNAAVLSSALIRGSTMSVLKPHASTSLDGHECNLRDCFPIISWYNFNFVN